MKLFPILLLLCQTTCVDLNFIIFGNGNGELRIKKVKTKETVKIIKVQVAEIRGGIAIDFRNDAIFYSDGNDIYKIFLVNEKGTRRVSGTGELLLNSNVDYFEILLFGGDHKIEGLFFDNGASLLYTTWNDKMHSGLFTIDTESGHVQRVFDADDCIPLRNPIIYSSLVYFTCPFYAYKRGLYKSQLSKYGRVGIRTGKDVNVSSFDVDRNTKRLYYSERSTIRVFDANPVKGIIVADSAATSAVKAIAVYGKYVIWSAEKQKRIFIGQLDEDMSFIPMKNVQVIDGTDTDPVEAHHIILF